VFNEPLPRNGSGISAISRSLHSNSSTRYIIIIFVVVDAFIGFFCIEVHLEAGDAKIDVFSKENIRVM
jgi:hypothetical protein